ncbi:MAG: MBL fold metallo-hydrolase [Saprospiraceae bacterium]|nr:MBL fold metallo-hydrolase [Saprospiraceae bacterium]
MKIYSIPAGFLKLDGGAMFGVVPKRMWEKLLPPDNNNLCTWAMRCMLVDLGERKILIDTGMGDKQDDKFKSIFEPTETDSLLKSLAQLSLDPIDITDVFLTHLHFDHCGGAVVNKLPDGSYEPTFPNATYWSNQQHWDWAMTPNPREQASFLKENFVPLQTSNQLKFIKENVYLDTFLYDNFSVRFVFGHTEAMMLPMINFQDKTIVFLADLIPSSFHIGLPYVMSYDMQPLFTLSEKERMLNEAVEQNYILFFEHDPLHECGTVKRNDKGRIVIDRLGKLSDFL